MIQQRQVIGSLKPYIPGKPIEEVKRELGLTDVIKLASNENPLGPSPMAVRAAAEAAARVHLYPEATAPELRQALARRVGLPEDHIIVGNGSDEIMTLLGRTYIDSGDEVVIQKPSFATYEHATRITGGIPVFVPLRDWRPDLEAMLARINPATKMVFICTPNNPTGPTVPRAELERFLARIPDGVLVILDEAYREYVDDPEYPDTVEYLRKGYPVVVLRTFSKIYGLAGLRVGYGLGDPEVLRPLFTVREPFTVNLVAQAAALAALQDEDHVTRSYENNVRGKEYLYGEFRRLGLTFVPTQANFILLNLGRPGRPVFEALQRNGVIVRPGEFFGLPEHIRVTIGTPEENRRFIEALEDVLQ